MFEQYMKYLGYTFILFTVSLNNGFAQAKLENYSRNANGFTLPLRFESKPYSMEGENNNIINYSNALDESKPSSPLLPSKTIFVAIPSESKVKLNFSNEKINYISNVFPKGNPVVKLQTDTTLLYEDTKINSTYMKTGYYPQERYFIEGYTWISSYYCVVIRINTHQYNWEERKISELLEANIMFEFYEQKPFIYNTYPLTDFDISLNKIILNYAEAKDYRSFPQNTALNDTTGTWIDYSKEYVKLAIPDDGIYRIDYNDIVSYGISPQSINPKTFKIFSKGEEIPLFVSGEDDNSFDPVDYIEFWATKNYGYPNYRNLVTQGEDYLPFLDIYSDTSIVWLSWSGENGERASEMNNYIPGLTDSISSHQVKIHLEQDNLLWGYGFELPRIQLPFWHENKTWIWQQVTNTGTSSFPFKANSILPNTPVYTISRLNSWYSDGLRTNAHKYGSKLNSSPIQDSVTFSFETIANLEAVFGSNDLIEGTNNYNIIGMPNDLARDHQALVDWIDVEYFQYTNAVNDSILIRIPDSVSSQLRIIKVSGFTSGSPSAVIYKIKPEIKRITSFLINESTLTFTDTIKGGDQYFVVNNNYLKFPVLLSKKKFMNLRDQNKKADYLLITHQSLQPSAMNYSNFIETSYKIKVETIFVEDIYDEFGYGYLKPEPIKELLKYAHFNWQTPKPSYLVLLGDCTYDYKNLFTAVPLPRKQILVPSFGNPVSDAWFTMWDTTNVNIQQMLVGRIPANTNEEVYRYLEKHQTYIQRDFDEWNKNFMLFSGGYPEYPSEMEQMRQANNKVLTNIIQPAPVGGETIHFYKTLSPPTNLGPYSSEEIRQGLDNGGLFISYVGHSGTRTWDNGITEPSDIKNIYGDRLPVVSDNGCSTGKFAEPDIDAFGELFVNQDVQGQAIVYLGNSSLGYTSFAFRMPEVFHKRLVVDSTMSIGEAHFLAKMDNFNQAGFSDVNRLYNYCNTLLGDPIIKIASPVKPNFVLNENSIRIIEEFITDNTDSIGLKLIVGNWGKVVEDSLGIDINSTYFDSIAYSNHFLIKSPLFHDTLNFKIPVYGLVGKHQIKVELDRDDLIEEISEKDNSIEISFIVYSTKIRPIESELFYNSSRSSAKVLNPTTQGSTKFNEIELELSQNPDFTNQILLTHNIDSVATTIKLNTLLNDTRYYWHVRLKEVEHEWSQTVSFFNSAQQDNYSWFINDSFNPDDLKLDKIEFDSSLQRWRLKKGTNDLKIASAGFSDGKYASIQYNFLEYVSNTFFRGFATALVDDFDLHPYDVKTFKFPVTPSRDSLISFLNSLNKGTILAIAATDEVSTYFSDAVGDSLKRLLKGFGSIYVDSVGWRDSWAMIGIKGALQGTTPEAFSKSLQGPAVIDTLKFVQFSSGTIQFPVIENSMKWLNVIKSDSIPSGAFISYIPIGYKNNGEADTLSTLQFFSNEASIESIEIKNYDKISILAELKANSLYESPAIKDLAVNFAPPPELGTNYQVVAVEKDMLEQGENAKLSFYVYNVGESPADSFNVVVELVKPDNSRQKIFEEEVTSLGSEQRKLFTISYSTLNENGSRSFGISIDSDNEVTELYEDNNFYTIPFYIKADTTKPSLFVAFNGNDIMDGDYIVPNPTIRMELSDPSILPIVDTIALAIQLDDIPIYFAQNPNILTYQFNPANPKMVVEYKPVLKEGEHLLKVFANDGFGNLVDSSGFQKRFLVSGETKILNVYNYPNPVRENTYFTFRLTQIPDQVKIMVYTIAGRLVREIIKTRSELNTDFNKIFWDCRDEDGDLLGNGTYLYKVIMDTGEKTESSVHKLAIVR